MDNEAFEDDTGVVSQGHMQLTDLDKTHGQEGMTASPAETNNAPKPKESEKDSKVLFLPINGSEKQGELVHTNGHTGKSATTTSNGDDAEDDIVCGVGSFTPACLQRFMSIGYFTGFYSMAGLLTSALNVYISSQITTLEKYYNFSSSVSGFLMSCNDIGYLLTTLLMSFYSRRVHIPRALSLSTLIFGVSGITCVLAYVLTKDEHSSMTRFYSRSHNRSAGNYHPDPAAQLCDNSSLASSGRGDTPDAGGISEGWKAFALSILAVGLFVQGIAKSPRHPFLGTYIDDNVPKTKTTKYLGIIGGLGIFGPAMAFILGGIFSKFYVTLEDPGITTRDPRWIGAWWLGFLFFGGAAVLASIPLSCFPRRLKGRRNIEEAEPEEKGGAEDDKKSTVVAHDLRAFFKSLRRLLSNPVYSLVVLAVGINMTGIAGYMAFAAKYLETQFTVPVFKANMTLGSLNVASAALGTVMGGFMVSRLKLSPRTCLKVTLVFSAISLLISGLSFVLGCEQPYIHTSGDSVLASDGTLAKMECADHCNCDSENFFPVCGADGRNYFSPCHAGCTDVLDTNEFVNCSCVFSNTDGFGAVPPAMANQTATAGLCNPNCPNFYPYVSSMFFKAFFATLTIMPNFVIYVRAVSELDKPLAMGFMAFSTTVLGWLPGPMIYGALVDTCCEIWNSEGACSLYNLSDFRFRFHLLIMICRGVSMALFVGVFLFVSFSKTFEFNSHTDDDEEAKATLPSDKQPDQNGKYQYHSINQPFKMRSKIGGSPQP